MPMMVAGVYTIDTGIDHRRRDVRALPGFS
jgi:hypothetical protein